MAERQTHAGERNGYRKRQRKHQAHGAALAQQEPTFGNGVPYHGGHIPS